MVSPVVVLGAAALVVVLVVVGSAVGTYLLHRYDDSGERRTDDVALPSGYFSVLHTDPSNYPGYCPECGTSNDPDYSLCRNCSAELPTQRRESPDGDLEDVFRT